MKSLFNKRKMLSVFLVLVFSFIILSGHSIPSVVAEAKRPLAVVIANNKAALPQYGLSRASTYYEAPVEGGMTRLLVIFNNYDDLDRIGPVRSARDYFVYEAMGAGAIFAHWGLAVPYCGDLINGTSVDNISAAVRGIDTAANEAFKRVSRPGKALEFTGYLDIAGYNSAVTRLGYSTSGGNQQFTFSANVDYSSHPQATKVYPGGTSNNSGGYGNAKPYFEYNAENKLYYRFQYGGKHIDEMNNEQLTVANVVFQYMNGEARDANGYLKFDVTGNGRAQIFTNGRVVEGTWKRDDISRPAKFYDANGTEVVLSSGKTWICVIRNSHAEHARYE
jgi:hypothetical protein